MMKKFDNGVLYMLMSALISALNGALTKVLTHDISALEIVFFRNLFGVVLILFAIKHTPITLFKGHISLLFMRGLFGFMAMILFFYTISVIPLGEAITLNKTSPFFVTLLAFLFLKERLYFRVALALFIGFCGTLLITKPFGMTFSSVDLLGVLGGFFAASAYTTIKKIKDIFDARLIVLSFVLVGSVLPALLFCLAPFVSAPQSIAFLVPTFILPNTLWLWFLLSVMGFISTLSQWFLTKAYSAKNLSVIGVISYTNIPFAIGFGWLLGDRFPDILTFLGIVFIIFGGILVSWKKG